jgi:hypothetical protein
MPIGSITTNEDAEQVITGSITANGQSVDISGPLQATEVVQITGTWAGTIVVEGTNDGSTYGSFPAVLTIAGLPVTNITTNGFYVVNTNAFSIIHLRSTAWTSGTATINVYGSEAASLISTIGLVRGGTDGTIIGNVGDAIKVSGNFSSGLPDRSTFTYGTTAEQPIGGVFQDTSPTVTAGQTGAIRMTQYRALHSNLRDNSGNEIGVAGNPLRIDPTGTTTQPVSATSWPLPTGAATETTLSAINTKLNSDFGASTGAVRVAALLGNASGAAAFGAGTTNAQTLRVVFPTDQTAIPATQSGTWTTGRTWTLASGTDSVASVQSGAWSVSVSNFPADADALAQGSTTSGQLGGLDMGAVTTASPSYTTGQTSPLSLTPAGALRVDGSAVTQPVSGTVTANQGTSPWIVQDNASNTSGAAAVARGLQTMGVFNTTPATLSNGQSGFLQLDSSQNLLVNLKTALPAGSNNIGSVNQGTSPWVVSVSNFPSDADALSQGSTTSGQLGLLGMGAVTTAAPSYTTAQTSPLSLTTAGALRVDGSAVTQPISGTVTSNQGTSPWVTKDQSDGPVTPGAVASFSQLMGGQFNTVLPTLTNGQQASLQVDSSGRLITAPQTITVGVADKSAFTYGTTTQSIIGGVYQDTSPTLTAGQQGGVRVNQNRALHTTLRDPTTDIGVTSDNNGTANNQRLHVATPDTTTAVAALGALNATVSVSLSGLPSAGFQIAAGTLIGTLLPEYSMDGGTTWWSSKFYDIATAAVYNSITFGSSNTAAAYTVITLGGTSHVRVRVSAYTSGTANALMRASHGSTIQITPAGAGSGVSAFGTVTNTYVLLTASVATLILAANPSRKYMYVSNPNGNVITIQLGSSTGLTGTNRGLVLPANSYFELKGDNLYTGAIYAFTTAGTVTLSITEGTP